MANPNIKGDMVEVSEFPQIAVKYNVRGVPVTVINEDTSVVGAVSDLDFAKKVLEAIGK